VHGEKATELLLFLAMEAGRKETLIKIREGLIQDDNEYPIAAALTDLEQYYSAGTFSEQ